MCKDLISPIASATNAGPAPLPTLCPMAARAPVRPRCPDLRPPARDRGSLVRRLALAKLRELKRQGFSYREIGASFAHGPGEGRTRSPGGFAYRLPAAPLLEHSSDQDQKPFFRALDVLTQGLAFFDCAGNLLHVNAALRARLEPGKEGRGIRAELALFADALCRLVTLRNLHETESVERLAVREVPVGVAQYQLQGGFIGFNLFGSGACVVITLEQPSPDSLSLEALRARFGLTRQEACVARLLAEGKSNAEIVRTLFISAPTARHHTQQILRKLGLHSRAEVAARLLRQEQR